MIAGQISQVKIPTISLEVAGVTYLAVIDTGFNGYLELPSGLRSVLPSRYTGRVKSLLAGGQCIEEETYLVHFPFDGEVIEANVTFVDGEKILVGTQMLRNHRLEIDFPAGTVVLQQA